MTTPVTVLALASLLAVINNGCVEYLFGTPFDKWTRLQPYKWLLMYLSVVTSLLICFVFDVNLFSMVGIGTVPGTPQHALAVVLTAILVARGSNIIADLPWPNKPATAALSVWTKSG